MQVDEHNRRAVGGRYLVLFGKNRVAAARATGFDGELDCVLSSGITEEVEKTIRENYVAVPGFKGVLEKLSCQSPFSDSSSS